MGKNTKYSILARRVHYKIVLLKKGYVNLLFNFLRQASNRWAPLLVTCIRFQRSSIPKL